MAVRRQTKLTTTGKLFGKIHRPAVWEDSDDDAPADNVALRFEENHGGDSEDVEADEGTNETKEVFVPPGRELGVTLGDFRTADGGFRAVVELVIRGGISAAAGICPGDELVSACGVTPAKAKGVLGVLAAIASAREDKGFEAVFFRASGFDAKPTPPANGGSCDAVAVEGAALFREAMKMKAGDKGASLSSLSFSSSSSSSPSVVSDAVRRGSLAEHGWFALELFDALEYPATGGGSGLFLDVSGAKRRRGAPLIVWPLGSGDGGGGGGGGGGGVAFPENQLWRHDASTGCLHSKLAGLVCDVAGSSKDPGAKLITWIPTGAPNQVFRVDKVAQSGGDLVVSIASSLQNGGHPVVLGVHTNDRAAAQAHGGGAGGAPRRSWFGRAPSSSSYGGGLDKGLGGDDGGDDDGGGATMAVPPGSRAVTVDAGIAELGSAGGALTAWRVVKPPV